MQRSSPGGWHQDFMQQQNNSVGKQQAFQQPMQQDYGPMQQHQGFGPMSYNGPFAGQEHMNGSALGHQVGQQDMQQDVELGFDEAAFDRAFESARSEMEQLENESQQQELSANQDQIENLLAEQSIETDHLQELERIGADRILPPEKRESAQNPQQDADELARTAGQLLDSVKHDQSQKFQESNFLALMRRLRDREVGVDGDTFRDVSTSHRPLDRRGSACG